MKPRQRLILAAITATIAAAAHAEPDRLGLTLDPLLIVDKASGPAARAGIRPGDKLLAVDGTPLETIAALQPYEKVTGTVALLVRRGGETFYVPVVLD